MPEANLYERLGGAFAIAAVIHHFSDAAHWIDVKREHAWHSVQVTTT
jgi:hypothetical protein